MSNAVFLDYSNFDSTLVTNFLKYNLYRHWHTPTLIDHHLLQHIFNAQRSGILD